MVQKFYQPLTNNYILQTNSIMATITEREVRLILKHSRLQGQSACIFMRNLRKQPIRRLNIREVLSEEDQPSKQIYFLLQGSVYLIRTLINGQKSIISEINQSQFLNMEILLNRMRSKYTIVVSSSYIRYITLQQKDFNPFVNHLISQLQNTVSFRQKQVLKKNKKIEEALIKKKLQENINKLILPNIDSNAYKKKTISHNQQQNFDENTKVFQNLTTYPKSMQNISKTSSLQKLSLYQKRKIQIESIQQQNQQQVSSKIFENFHEYRDKITQKRIQRLKSERSISPKEKQPKEINYVRNQRLFKQQLKKIVHRKLLFETNHSKVLKRLNNKDQKYNPKQLNLEALKKMQQQKQNPIDSYFNL